MQELKDTFSGTHFQTLDEKARVPFPAKLLAALQARVRQDLAEHCPGAEPPESPSIVVSISLNGRIGVYTASEYKITLEKIRRGEFPRLSDIDPDSLIIDMENFKEVQVLDKQNRFRIPQVLLEALEFNREVAFLGSGDYVEIIPKEKCVGAASGRLKDLQRRHLGLPSQANERG